MVFDWSDYLVLAGELREAKAATVEEAAKRSSVSRAYYAAYGAAFRYCLAHGYRQFGTGRDHSGVRDHLRTPAINKPDIATALLALSRWRIQCDYRDRVPGSLDDMSAWALVWARSVIDAL